MPITSADFLTRLSNPAMPWGAHNVNVDGTPIWFRVRRRNSTAVVFTFQGTIDRDETPIPVYGTDLADDIPNATIIGLSDPAMDLHADLGSGWYAGWEGCDLQGKLGSFFLDMIAALGATRVIFQGSSAGGFAALYYGSLVPDSIVIALNPQTDLDAYPYTTKYRAACWPNLGTDPLSSVIDCDLIARYDNTTTFTQSIVYLVNEGDAHHVNRHFLPFWEGTPEGKWWRMIKRIVYFGENTHTAIPEDLWVPWVQAAVNAQHPTRPVNANELRALMEPW